MSDNTACLTFVKRTVDFENICAHKDNEVTQEYVVDAFMASMGSYRETE